MGNCVYGFTDCARAQRSVRLAADAEGVDWSAAWRAAEQELTNFGIATADGIGIPAGHYSDDWGRVHKIVAPKPRTPELQINPRVRCFEHQEKAWTAPSGNYYACCPVENCRWGQLSDKGRRVKKHSDGVDHSVDEFLSDVPQTEPTDDFERVVELGVKSERVLTAGQDDPEDVDDSLQNIDEFFSDDEIAESESQHEDDSDEADEA